MSDTNAAKNGEVRHDVDGRRTAQNPMPNAVVAGQAIRKSGVERQRLIAGSPRYRIRLREIAARGMLTP
ncbi:hypothetical protein SPHN_04965 [Sphingomonas faeni]|nr:hypothetical protein [Sphingomonas faeni]